MGDEAVILDIQQKFTSSCASHQRGVWERLIMSVGRLILLLIVQDLTINFNCRAN